MPGCRLLLAGHAEKATAASAHLAAAQLDQNCCAIFGTQAVLAESPKYADAAKRGLIFRQAQPTVTSYRIKKARFGRGRKGGKVTRHGTRTVLAESPKYADAAKRGLIFSASPANSNLVSLQQAWFGRELTVGAVTRQGTQAVLAEPPKYADAAKRGLIFSASPANSNLVSHQ